MPFRPDFGTDPRKESLGEAQIRLAGHLIKFFMVFGVRFHKYEQDAMAKVVGAFIRRYPILAGKSK